MSRCKGCGGEYRKGSIAVLFFQKGGSARTRVCPGCVKRGVLVVPELLAPVIRKVEKRGDEVEQAIKILTVYANSARRSQADQFNSGKWPTNEAQASFFQGREEGLLTAIERLKSIGRS
jgi:hypothetical protein